MKEGRKGKESPFGSHEISRPATGHENTMETESILRTGEHRFLRDWHRSDLRIEATIFSKRRKIGQPRNPSAFFRFSSSRKPLTCPPSLSICGLAARCFAAALDYRFRNEIRPRDPRRIARTSGRRNLFRDCPCHSTPAVVPSQFRVSRFFVGRCCFENAGVVCPESDRKENEKERR